MMTRCPRDASLRGMIQSSASPGNARPRKDQTVIERILGAIGIGVAASPRTPPASPDRFEPYKNRAPNVIYKLLFCDDLELLRTGENEKAEGPLTTLLAKSPDTSALRVIADDASLESRLRVLAYNRLRENGAPVPSKN